MGPASAWPSGDWAWCGQAEADAEEEPLWQCPVRLVTFIGVGRDPHTFGLIADLGCQSFQCAAFWCQPHAGALSEAVQAACMVSQGWEWWVGLPCSCFILVAGAQDSHPV